AVFIWQLFTLIDTQETDIVNNDTNINQDTNIHNDSNDTMEYDHLDTTAKAWEPSNEMLSLTSDIYHDNTLSKNDHFNIIKNQPANKLIMFKPPTMDAPLWQIMSKEAKHTDTLLQKVAYRASTILRPIDNLLRNTYESRPENDDGESIAAWQEVETTLLQARALVLDTLSFTNDIRRDKALKLISPNYKPKADHSEVFGKCLHEFIEKENATNKLIHKALLHKKRGLEIGGYLRYCAHSWLRLFSSSWVTSVISEGYMPIWLTPPPISIQHMSKRYFKPTEFSSLCSEIQSLLDKKVICHLDTNVPCFVSNLLLIPKKTGDLRPVIDLRNLNRYVKYSHFKIETIEMVKNLLRRNDYMVTIDLQDTFFHSMNIYKDLSPSDNTSQVLGNSYSGISRRHYNFGEFEEDSPQSFRDHTPTVDSMRVSHQQRKVSPITNSKFGVSRFPHKHTENDPFSNTKESQRYYQGVQNPSSTRSSPHPQIGSINREIDRSNRSSLSQLIEVTGTIERQDYCTQTQGMELIPDPINEESNSTQMVDKEPEILEQSINNTSNTMNYNKRTNTAHKSIGIESNRSRASILQRNSELHHPAKHIPGTMNIMADQALRQKPEPFDWKIKKHMFNRINQIWGPFRPDPFAEGTNALNQSWNKIKGWANPPWILIPQILAKSLLIEQPIRLPSHCIIQGPSTTKIPWRFNQWKIFAWLLSGASMTVSSNIKKWLDWCEIIEQDPITCSLSIICEFLLDQLVAGKAYNTIAEYRSAISEIHDFIDSTPISKHPDVCRVMQAIHNENLPPIRSDDLIDLTSSLDYIIRLNNNTEHSLLYLNQKTAFLCALGTASRPSDLSRLDLTSLTITTNAITLNCLNPKELKISNSRALTQGSRATRSSVKKIVIGDFENRSLSPKVALLTMLEATQHLRTTREQKECVFLSSMPPHAPASSVTIA
ncbi:24406_t:CDS:2, partial [Cetraspora pellucida]